MVKNLILICIIVGLCCSKVARASAANETFVKRELNENGGMIALAEEELQLNFEEARNYVEEFIKELYLEIRTHLRDTGNMIKAQIKESFKLWWKETKKALFKIGLLSPPFRNLLLVQETIKHSAKLSSEILEILRQALQTLNQRVTELTQILIDRILGKLNELVELYEKSDVVKEILVDLQSTVQIAVQNFIKKILSSSLNSVISQIPPLLFELFLGGDIEKFISEVIKLLTPLFNDNAEDSNTPLGKLVAKILTNLNNTEIEIKDMLTNGN